MRSPVIAKLRAPNPAAAIPRTVLFKRLDAELRGGRIVWVTASAGAGKTTLAASYLAACRRKHLWYQLDVRDADPATFFHYLREAAARIAPRARRTLAALTPEYAFGLDTFARNFFEQLGGILGASCVLILDNYHELPNDSPVHGLFAQGLRVLPEELGVLVLSRAESPAAFATFRAARRLTALVGDVLALTAAETRALARRYRFNHLTAEAVANLHAHTRGWAAGAVLMLEEAARAQAAVPRFDQPMTQAMFDYFAAEVLQHVSEAQQKVLLETALLPEVSAEAARALTGEQQPGRILAEFARRGYFVYAVAGREPVYQYHPLFREFLLARLERDISPAALAELRRRAAAAIAAAGNTEDAVALWIKADAWEELIQYVCGAAPELLAQGRGQVLAGWIQAVPAAAREANPWLRFWLGHCVLPFDPAAARASFESALRSFQERGERHGALLAWCGLVDVALHIGGDLAMLDPWIDRFPAIAGSGPLPEAIDDQVVVRMCGALVLRQPQHPDIDRWRERAEHILQFGNNLDLQLTAGVHLCLHSIWIGEVSAARRQLHWLSSLARAPGVAPLLFLLVRATEALSAALVEADAKASLEIIESAAECAQRVGVHVWDFHLACHGVAAMLAGGDLDAAHEQLERLRPALSQVRLLDVGYYYYLAHWAALQRGDLAAAEAHSHAAMQLRDPIGLAFGRALLASMVARTHIALGRFDAARQWLDEAHEIARATRSHLLGFSTAMDEARLALCQGDRAGVHDWLGRGFATARAQGLINFHGWCAPVMAELCAHALEAGIETGYVQALIRRRGLVPPAAAESLGAWPWRLRIHTLGRFGLVHDGKRVQFEGRVQKRALDLLKILIALGGRDVAEQKLCDALWPDAEGDDARANLKMTLHRLRAIVGHDAIVVRESKLSLNPRICWVDAWDFARLANRLVVAGDTLAAPERTRLGEQMQALYRGPFLDSEDGAIMLTARERLRNSWLRTIGLVASGLQREGAAEPAIAWYERGLGVEPLAEPFYQGIMRICLDRRHAAEGLAAYERLRRLLAGQLKVAPAPESEALARALLALAPPSLT